MGKSESQRLGWGTASSASTTGREKDLVARFHERVGGFGASFRAGGKRGWTPPRLVSPRTSGGISSFGGSTYPNLRVVPYRLALSCCHLRAAGAREGGGANEDGHLLVALGEREIGFIRAGKRARSATRRRRTRGDCASHFSVCALR